MILWSNFVRLSGAQRPTPLVVVVSLKTFRMAFLTVL